MKNITIDFTAEHTVSDYVLGKMGEHNAATVTFTPPEILSDDERTDHYRVAFATGGRTVLSESFTEIPFSIPLRAQLTGYPRMSMQIIAYDLNGEFVGKSDKISGFCFESSVHGTEIVRDYENHDIAFEVGRLRSEMPAKTSDLENDGEGDGAFITQSDIPASLPNPHKLTVNGTDYDGSQEVVISTQSSEEARLAAAELAGHHAADVPIIYEDDYSKMFVFLIDPDYSQSNPSVFPEGAKLLKMEISDDGETKVFSEQPFCVQTVEGGSWHILGHMPYDDNEYWKMTWLGEKMNFAVDLTAEIWWEE